MAKNIIKGDDLMLFDAAGHSIAYATAHTLTLSADAVDITTKDHGIWGGKEVNKINWEITSENLYTSEEYGSLFDMMLQREKITVYFGSKKENDPEKTVANDDYPYWTGNKGWYGEAFITSLVANANTGENATFSLTLTGSGKFVKANEIPVAEAGE